MLYILSLPYLFISYSRAFFYKNNFFSIQKITKPVIAVGNISVGGTGKTPFCIELIQLCIRHQLLPAIVSRGYGNDEQRVYQNRFPHIPMAFSANRVNACNSLLKSEPKISLFILDDAFQHQKIHRDLNLLLINALDPFGLGYCLPRGFLRESLKAIHRADAIILTRADEVNGAEKQKIKEEISSLAGKNTPIFEATHEPESLVSPIGEVLNFEQFFSLRYQKMAGLCGIAQPNGFFNTLMKINIIPNKKFIYPDHYQYLSNDFDFIAKERETFDCLITTEKDIVKIPLDLKKQFNIYTLTMRMKILEADKIISLVKEISK